MMPAQQGSEPENKAVKLKEEFNGEIEKSKVGAKTVLAKTKAEEKARLKLEKALAETRKALAVAQAEAEQERGARLEVENALTEAREAIATIQGEIEQERRARMKAEQATAEAERAVVDAKKSLGFEVENVEFIPPTPLEQDTEQRVTFILRVTIDEQGQPLRIEVEHAQSGKKEKIPSMDIQRLAAFMNSCISPPAVPAPGPRQAHPLSRAEVLTPQPPMPITHLTVSEVQLFRIGTPGVAALVLSPSEDFMVQSSFRLEGSEAFSLSAKESPFEIKVYAHEVTRGTSTLLTAYQANLVEDVLEYTAQLRVPGLSTGLYRLFTLVTTQAPINMAGYYEGPVFQIGETQPTPGLVAPLEGSLSR